ncbi:hypothetical protein MY04_1375 [Flammeovirga sp. MY04]|uniref:hypothetical protein n=1 Tax=Flammeovirga sp. MY04 TaxID=1191459 RepID=UPI0008063570|nr:hypothetical protein [Flammeovirga sp. MY04]ANQ48751.1 hypothetical protein MY04_1375 [Flammeovirga sp. MY04]
MKNKIFFRSEVNLNKKLLIAFLTRSSFFLLFLIISIATLTVPLILLYLLGILYMYYTAYKDFKNYILEIILEGEIIYIKNQTLKGIITHKEKLNDLKLYLICAKLRTGHRFELKMLFDELKLSLIYDDIDEGRELIKLYQILKQKKNEKLTWDEKTDIKRIYGEEAIFI